MTQRRTDRPRSPNIQHYAPQLTSVLSITHRLSGLVLAGGAVLLVAVLVCLAAGPPAWHALEAVLLSMPGRALLFLFSFAFFYHLLNGIRHLFWDFHVGFSLPAVYVSGWLVLGASVLLALLALWFAAGMEGGA